MSAARFPTIRMLRFEGYVRFGEGALAEPYAHTIASWLQERGYPACAVPEHDDPHEQRWVVYWKPKLLNATS